MVQKHKSSMDQRSAKEESFRAAALRSIYEDSRGWFLNSDYLAQVQEYEVLQHKAQEYKVFLDTVLDHSTISSIWMMVKGWRSKQDVPRDTRAALYHTLATVYKAYGANVPALKLALYMVNRLFLQEGLCPSYTSLAICPEFGDATLPVSDVVTSFFCKIMYQLPEEKKKHFNENILIPLQIKMKGPKGIHELQEIDEEIDEVLRGFANVSE